MTEQLWFSINFNHFLFNTNLKIIFQMIPQFVLKNIVKMNTIHPPSPRDWIETEIYIKELEKAQLEIIKFEEISTVLMGRHNKIQPTINSMKLLLHYEKKEGMNALREKKNKGQRTPISLNQVFLWYSNIILFMCQENSVKRWW